jgi:hypothetical protein
MLHQPSLIHTLDLNFHFFSHWFSNSPPPSWVKWEKIQLHCQENEFFEKYCKKNYQTAVAPHHTTKKLQLNSGINLHFWYIFDTKQIIFKKKYYCEALQQCVSDKFFVHWTKLKKREKREFTPAAPGPPL